MYHFIVNPASRSGKGIKIWKKQVEPVLLSKNIPYQVHFSERPGHTAVLARKILSSSEVLPVSLVILGGDGTVNEALQGIDDTSGVVLGYIPTGSSNDLARDLKIPKKPAEALQLILRCPRPTPMDLGTVTYSDGEKRRFAVSCGIGFDAAVCQEALHSTLKNAMNKIGLGKLTYLGIALKQLMAAGAVSGTLTPEDSSPITVNNMLFTACMLHRFEGGGFMFAPDADARDGILNMCTAGGLSKLKILVALPSAFRGKHFRFRGITPSSARRLVIETSVPLWVHTDGEVSRKSSRITVSCQQDSILFLCPDSDDL